MTFDPWIQLRIGYRSIHAQPYPGQRMKMPHRVLSGPMGHVEIDVKRPGVRVFGRLTISCSQLPRKIVDIHTFQIALEH